MALKSTIYKLDLSIADIDHGYYAEHALTIARHPSETEVRLMIRILAFAINAHEVQTRCKGEGSLSFGAGLSNPDDADLWVTDFQQRIKLWIDVGQPEDKPIARACQRSDSVRIYCFSQAAALWWKRIEPKVKRFSKLEVLQIPSVQANELGTWAQRQMSLQATIQEGAISLSNDAQTLVFGIESLS